MAKKGVDGARGRRQNPRNVDGEDESPSKPLLPPSTDSHGISESESNQMPTDSLHVLSKRELIAVARLKLAQINEADVRNVAAHFRRYLQTLRGRAREGKNVEEASEFARLLTCSGLLRLFDGADRVEVAKLAQDTLYDCDAFWHHEGRGPWVALSELEAVNAKLNCLAVLLSQGVNGKDVEQLTQDSAVGVRLLPAPVADDGSASASRAKRGRVAAP